MSDKDQGPIIYACKEMCPNYAEGQFCPRTQSEVNSQKLEFISDSLFSTNVSDLAKMAQEGTKSVLICFLHNLHLTNYKAAHTPIGSHRRNPNGSKFLYGMKD